MKVLPLVIIGLPLSYSTSLLATNLHDDLANAIKQSTVSAQFRYRLESVTQDNALDDTLASTLRSRLNLNTGKVAGFSALVQLDNVSVMGGDLYNSTVNGQNHYSVVADPTGTDLNQALLRYQNESGSTFNVGRQLVNQLNQRFLGGVGWRQNEQTLDGYRYEQKFGADFSLDLGHFFNVNRIFGPSGAAADQHGKFNSALLSWQLAPAHSVAVFNYDVDFDLWAVRSSRTTGADYQGKLTTGPKLSWQLAAAQQQDSHQAPQSFSHNYHRISLSWALDNVTLQAGEERMAGDGQSAFQTPLATLHAFNGFADVFLNTPVNGLRDYWLQADTVMQQLTLSLAFHRFEADKGSNHYGNEWNISANYSLTKQLAGLIKLAHYSADGFATDTSKVWLMLTYQL